MSDFIREKARYVRMIFDSPGFQYTTEKENQLVGILNDIYNAGFASGQIPTEGTGNVEPDTAAQKIIEEAKTEPAEEKELEDKGSTSENET